MQETEEAQPQREMTVTRQTQAQPAQRAVRAPSAPPALNECANRFAWMYQTSLQEGVMVPIAVRNIIDGCVQLGFAGDARGPQRLHVIVLRPDGGPDTSAKVSAFSYPRTNVDAGRKLEFEGMAPGSSSRASTPAPVTGTPWQCASSARACGSRLFTSR